MFNYSPAFDRPGYLLLLGLIPLLWVLGTRSLAGWSRARRWGALGLRSLVVAAVVAALADVQWRRRSDQLTVVYLLDQSLSIPAAVRQEMFQYVADSVGASGARRPDDRFAVIAFGREPAVEAPPTSTPGALPTRLESVIDPELSDLSAAVKQAQALFPADAAKRIVLVTDGNENRGSVFREARAAAEAGVSIDVAPITLSPRGEAAVEKLDMPSAVRRGQPFDVRVVLFYEAPPGDPAPIAGTLRLVRRAGEREETVAEEPVELAPGRRVLTLREEIDRSDFYTYEVRFVPDDPATDGLVQNNVATAFTHIRGKGNVLVVENFDARGQADFLVDRLRAQEIEATVTATDQLFGSLAELQRYDAVVLVNVSRSGSGPGDDVAAFSDEQIEMLVRNTREMGCGLVMIGGPDTFGAGGWANTRLEEAMPVDFQIKSAEARMVGALSIVIDRSGSMDGEKLAMSKAAAIAAVRTLGRRDLASVVSFDSEAYHVAPIQRVDDGRALARRIDGIASGGGTDMYPGMVRGFEDLQRAEAAVKHMIVLTDGQTPEADFAGLVRRMRAANVSVTTVAVGSDANMPLLQEIARQGRGKFYPVHNPRNLPRIFLNEVRRVSRPLVYEPPLPVVPQVVADHEILSGLVEGVPPITGLVLTSVKESPLVEVVLRSPQPANPKNATVLATWSFGAGKAAAFTSDAGRRWAISWPGWEGYDKFFGQLVRWAMRPTDDAQRYAVAANVREGRTQIVVTAMDADEEVAGASSMTALAIAPDMTAIGVRLEQAAPGRFIGEFASPDAGTYLIAVHPGGGAAPLRTGVNVGYSPEYRDFQTNQPLLQSLAELRAGAGPSGEVAPVDPERALPPAASSNPFRRDLPAVVASRTVWPWVVVAASCLFWADVFVRRVQIDWSWAARVWEAWSARWARRPPVAEAAPTMARLRSRKSEVATQLADRQRAASYPVGPPPTSTPGDESPRSEIAPVRDAPPAVAPPREASYTERLLQAKRDAQRRARDGDGL